MKVEVAVMGSQSLIALPTSVGVKQHCIIVARAQELCESQGQLLKTIFVFKSETRVTASVLK